MRIYIFGLLTLSLFSAAAQVSDLVDFTTETKVEGEFKSAPREQLQRNALQQVSEKLIREMVGDQKYDRNKAAIQSRVISQAERYVPLIRVAEPEKTDKGYKAQVSLKVSLKNLKEVLTKGGFLYLTENLPTVLPVIEVVDRVKGSSYRWWIPESTTSDQQVRSLSLKLLNEMRKELGARGFYLMDPVTGKYRELVPPVLRSESFRTEELVSLGEYFRASIVLRGRLALDKDSATGRGSVMRLELVGLQTENGRSVAELVRNFESRAGGFEWSVQQNMTSVTQEAAKELASQLQDVWQRGTLGSSSIRIALLGDVSFQDMEDFKREAQKVPQLKRLMERRISWEGVVFEADITGGPEALAKSLGGISLKHGKIELRSQSNSEIILRKTR